MALSVGGFGRVYGEDTQVSIPLFGLYKIKLRHPSHPESDEILNADCHCILNLITLFCIVLHDAIAARHHSVESESRYNIRGIDTYVSSPYTRLSAQM